MGKKVMYGLLLALTSLSCLPAAEPLRITLGDKAKLDMLQIVDSDSNVVVSMEKGPNPWGWQILKDRMTTVLNNKSGVISGVIADNGRRLAFRCQIPNNSDVGYYWVGLSVPHKIKKIKYRLEGQNKLTIITVPNNISDGTAVYIMRASDFSDRPEIFEDVPNFVYIDIPDGNGLQTVKIGKSIIALNVIAPHWGDLQTQINSLKPGQEISGTFFSSVHFRCGLAIPYVSQVELAPSSVNSGFISFDSQGQPELDDEGNIIYKKFKLAFSPVFNDMSNPPADKVESVGVGDQLVFRIVEKQEVMESEDERAYAPENRMRDRQARDGERKKAKQVDEKKDASSSRVYDSDTKNSRKKQNIRMNNE